MQDSSIILKGIREKSIVGKDLMPYKKENKYDKTLLLYLKKAVDWKREMDKDGVNITEISKRKKIDSSTVGRILNLNYLAPDIFEKIVQGKFPSTLCARELIHNIIPYDWTEQHRMYGFGDGVVA